MNLKEVLIDVIKRNKNIGETKAKTLLNKSIHKGDNALNECIIAEIEAIEKQERRMKAISRIANKELAKENIPIRVK